MSDQPSHPITLEQVFFTRCSVIAVPEHQPVVGQLTPGPENAIDVKKTEGTARRYAASMRTVINQSYDKVYPYAIDMECVGFFLADDTLSETEALREVTITANSVLYGAIREATAWLTSRQPYGALMLGLSILKGKPPEDVDQPESSKS